MASKDEFRQITQIFLLLGVQINTNMNSILPTEQSSTKTKCFSDDKTCKQYIQNNSTSKLILIVSGQLGHKLVPQIHDLPQVISIYVYCRDKSKNQKWASNFSKVTFHPNLILNSFLFFR